MGSPKLLLNIGLILATAIVFCIADYSKVNYRLPVNALPIHYNISLVTHLKGNNSFFYGEVNVSLIIYLGGSPSITLHSQELDIDETATTLQWLPYTLTGVTYVSLKPEEHIYNSEMSTLTLVFNDTLRFGIYFLSMKFLGHFSEDDHEKNGFIKLGRNNSVLAVTLFKPNKARRVFPCWDEPAYKATFQISVLHHREHTVLSNMPIQEQFEDIDNMTWTHFNVTPKMSTYLVGIIIMSNFDSIKHIFTQDKTINLLYEISLEWRGIFAHSIARDVRPLLVEYTTITLPVPKVDSVVVHDYPIDGMENWGLIFYKESEIIIDYEAEDPIKQKMAIARLVVHEVVHQWFGNLVTPSWWSHLWLSEGLATFFEAYFLDKIYAEYRKMDFLVVKTAHKSFALVTGLMSHIISERDIDNLFSHEIYYKAPVILRMLYLSLSEEIFKDGIIKYLNLKKFGSASSDEFLDFMQNAAETLSYFPFQNQGFLVKEAMYTWINQSYYPILNVTRNYETGEMTLTQKPSRGTNNQWWIPLTFAQQSVPDFSQTMAKYWLAPDNFNTDIYFLFYVPPNEWVIFNVQQTAYYRVYYDRQNWYKLMHYLNSPAYENIHVLNRAQIIDDAYFFLEDRKIHTDLFFGIVRYLSRETDYVAWYPMFEILSRLSRYFPLPESQSFKNLMKSVFNELFQKIGYENKPDDVYYLKILRLKALEWACSMGHPMCKRKAADKLNEYMNNSRNPHIIPEYAKDWMYCSGLMAANLDTWNSVFQFYQWSRDQKLLKMLTCSQNSTVNIVFMHTIVNFLNADPNRGFNDRNRVFNDTMHAYFFKSILQKHLQKNNDVVLDHILANFETLKPRPLTSLLVIKEILANVYFEGHINKVKNFSETNFHGDNLSEIYTCIEDRKIFLKKAVDTLNIRFVNPDETRMAGVEI